MLVWDIYKPSHSCLVPSTCQSLRGLHVTRVHRYTEVSVPLSLVRRRWCGQVEASETVLITLVPCRLRSIRYNCPACKNPCNVTPGLHDTRKDDQQHGMDW